MAQADRLVALEAMTEPEFWEIGARGRIYDRETVMEPLLKPYRSPGPHDWPCRDFRLRQLGAELYQIAYILEETGRRTRRSTLWRRQEDAWKIVFHKGTPMAP
jgi:hypothetical protein